MSHSSDLSTTVPSDDFHPPGSLRVEDQPFALVPEWVIDTDISDAAFRVYSLLLRYGNTSGQRMPSRKLLAVRLHRSVDAVDRAVRELADTGLVRIEHRRAGRRNLTNRYHLTTTDPKAPAAGVAADLPPPRRRHPRSTRTPRRVRAAVLRVAAHSAATPEAPGGRRSAGRVAAELRPDPEKKTQEPPPPTPSRPSQATTRWREEEVLTRCGITDLDAVVERCRHARRALDKPTGRWTRHTLMPASSSPSPAAGPPPSSSRRC